MRSRLVLVVLLLTVATAAWAQSQFVVEDWSTQALGSQGLPEGWRRQDWGSPKYDFTIVNDGGRKALHLKSAGDGSTASRDIKGKVDLKQTPILEWSWKVTTLPKGGDACRKEADDEAAQVYVAWPRFPEQVRSRIIGYVWDTTEPVGKICKSQKTGTVTYVVLRSGATELGTWLTERRNVVEDFKNIYHEDPDSPAAVSIAIDSNDTSSTAEAFIGPILFKKP